MLRIFNGKKIWSVPNEADIFIGAAGKGTYNKKALESKNSCIYMTVAGNRGVECIYGAVSEPTATAMIAKIAATIAEGGNYVDLTSLSADTEVTTPPTDEDKLITKSST